MAHHSFHDDAEIRLKNALDSVLGPTGAFPLGKLTAQDEGEIKLAIGTRDGCVIMDFGSQVVWTGFTPTQARLIAQTLNEKADQLDPLPPRQTFENEGR